MTHPAYPQQARGDVHVEISIVPKLMATQSPVGKGREEPNKDPHLPAVTENRQYITTTGFALRMSDYAKEAEKRWKRMMMSMLAAVLVLAIILQQYMLDLPKTVVIVELCGVALLVLYIVFFMR
mmetsp:Transcript_8823/g.21667  ORF Transcript_8823/g.21667 Transcript_8823/m.21667 type:complete len:124 (+) Transcript_8823:222-593(+)